MGKLYMRGLGVDQTYKNAAEYFELASSNHNPDSLFYLGLFYSIGDVFDVNIKKAVDYFLKSIEIHDDKITVYNRIDNLYSIKYIYNNYFYHSYNELGLIYHLS